LQRKCACGGSAGGARECEACADEKEKRLQRFGADRESLAGLPGLLATDGAGSPQDSSNESNAPGGGHTFGAVRVIQRAPLEQAGATGPAGGAAAAAVDARTTPGRGPAPAGLIVEDNAAQSSPGQMRRTEFLNQLESAVCAVADQELARVGRTAKGCPYIKKWIGFYRMQTSQHVERALVRYAPEAAGATSARDYIPVVAERARKAVTVWATTGQITGVPEELAGQMGGGGLLGAAGGILSSIGSAVGGAFGGVGRAIGGLFTKQEDGGARSGADPESVRGQLNAGESIDHQTRSRMERAFGHDFSQVRVHADTGAARLSRDFNARAFTIGSDVAFGAGEYRPGTLVGDALLAHELAHVIQQRSTSASSPLLKDGVESDALEDDADRAAVMAVISTRNASSGRTAGANRESFPRLRSSLGLRRCGPAVKQKVVEPEETVGDFEWSQPCILRALCPNDAGVVADLQKLTVKAADKITDNLWTFKQGQWTKRPVHPVGMNQADDKLVVMVRGRPCNDAVQTLFHEVRHQRQPAEMRKSTFQMELDAYIETEKWAIQRGFEEPKRKKSFRKTGPGGAVVPDEAVIREYVVARYGGPDAGGEEVVGHKEPNETEFKAADGTKGHFRPSHENDTHLEMNPALDNEEVIPPKSWQCPKTS